MGLRNAGAAAAPVRRPVTQVQEQNCLPGTATARHKGQQMSGLIMGIKYIASLVAHVRQGNAIVQHGKSPIQPHGQGKYSIQACTIATVVKLTSQRTSDDSHLSNCSACAGALICRRFLSRGARRLLQGKEARKTGGRANIGFGLCILHHSSPLSCSPPYTGGLRCLRSKTHLRYKILKRPHLRLALLH